MSEKFKMPVTYQGKTFDGQALLAEGAMLADLLIAHGYSLEECPALRSLHDHRVAQGCDMPPIKLHQLSRTMG